MPSELSEHAGFDAIFRVGAAIEVLSVKLLALRVLKKVLVQQFELGRGQLAVLFPPDGLLGVLVADDKLVLGATAGVDAGFSAQRATLHQLGFVVGERVLVKRRLGQVPMDRSKV